MDNSNSILINRFFTRNTFREILESGESSTYATVIKRYVKDGETLTNQECISTIYQFLKNEYQNEYYYKNTLLNKLLFGVHNPHTTTALTEVPIGKSKADFILINGKAVVYEIKTDLDNFDRLDGQIEDYYKAFSRVAVVTSERNYNDLKMKLKDSPVGMYVLTDRGTISERKKAIEDLSRLSPTTIFKILRKEEYEAIISHEYGFLPNVSQFEYYKKCKSLFEALPIKKIYGLFLPILKKRVKIEIEEIKSIPYPLKFLIYFSSYRKSDYSKLTSFLNEQEG